MQNIVVNKCNGEFSLSNRAIQRYAELKNIVITPIKNKFDYILYYYNGIEDNDHCFLPNNIARDDRILVQVISELGDLANGEYADLHVVEIPDNFDWYIENSNGIEIIHKSYPTW
jgi:hypothetical protein